MYASAVVRGLTVLYLSSKKPPLCLQSNVGIPPFTTFQGVWCIKETHRTTSLLKTKNNLGGILAWGNACMGNKISQWNSWSLSGGDRSLHCYCTWYVQQHLHMGKERHPKALFWTVLINNLAIILCDHPSTSIIFSWLHTKDCSLWQFLQEEHLVSVY